MKRYSPYKFEENNNYIDFSKIKDKITLYGIIKNEGYLIECSWYEHNFSVFAQKEEQIGTGVYNPFYGESTRSGGSPAQKLSPLFKLYFKIPVPKTDDLGSGLDVNHMIDVLIKKYKFKIK